MRKILCIVLAFIISSFSIFTCVLAEETNTSNTTDAESLKQQQEELQNQIDEANGELENVQNELSENLQQVQKLDEKIASSQTELDELNAKITELQTSIDQVVAELQKAEESYNSQKKIIRC